MKNKEKQLEEIFKDPMFDMDKISIGDIDIVKWADGDAYGSYCSDEQIAYGNDLFEVLRKTFC